MAIDSKRYFSDLETHQLDFVYDENQEHQLIDMAFNKNRSDDRKRWINAADVSMMSLRMLLMTEFVSSTAGGLRGES